MLNVIFRKFYSVLGIYAFNSIRAERQMKTDLSENMANIIGNALNQCRKTKTIIEDEVNVRE